MTSSRGVFTIGDGPPLVLVPGVQGRWEWMWPAVEALAAWFRVITYSLAGDRSSGLPVPGAGAFDRHVDQLERVMDHFGVTKATICGVSYGGLIAVRTAATRPSRVENLVLVSTPAPTWRPDERLQRYATSPRASTPGFVLGAPGRLWCEIGAARPGYRDRSVAVASYLARVCRYPASPMAMAGRVRCLAGHDFVPDARAVARPTLIVTGEPALDRVVPVAGTRQYLDLIPQAVGWTLDRTGHIGLITRPEAFAAALKSFVK